MLLIVAGKSCAGKTTVRNILCEKYGFEPIITYTTRKKRDGEVNGKDYHFISFEEFKDMMPAFAEIQSYTMANGKTVLYGTKIEDLLGGGDKVIILTPDGIRELKDIMYECKIDHYVIYLYANQPTIKTRMTYRGDDFDEIERRMAQDNKDFKYFENEADKIVMSNVNAEIVAESVNEIVRRDRV